MSARMLPAALGTVLVAALVACSCGSNRAGTESGPSAEPGAVRDAAGVPRAARASAPAAIRGTVVEAATGRPLAGVEVQGPAGTRAVSDAEGRFEIRGLPPGTQGELLATSEEGLHGVNRLRPLRSGTLEVVLHLR